MKTIVSVVYTVDIFVYILYTYILDICSVFVPFRY